MRSDISFRPLSMTSTYKDSCIVKITYLKLQKGKNSGIESEYYTNVDEYVKDDIGH